MSLWTAVRKAIETHASPKFTVDPREGTVADPGGRVRLEPKVMEVLAALAEHPGCVVSREELLDTVWPGVVVTEHTLSRCIYQLRHELGKIGRKPGQAENIGTCFHKHLRNLPSH